MKLENLNTAQGLRRQLDDIDAAIRALDGSTDAGVTYVVQVTPTMGMVKSLQVPIDNPHTTAMSAARKMREQVVENLAALGVQV